MQTSTPSRQALAQVDTREATIAMVQSTTSHGAWKWIGLNPTATVEVHQHCTPSLAMAQMAAQHGDAGPATTTMDEPLSTCVSSIADGSWTTIRDGQVINSGSLSPSPGGFDWGVIKSSYESKGAVIYSSEWSGWVPVEDCGTSGNLPGSHFSVSNLRIKGSIVQGPTPRACGSAVVANQTLMV